MQRVTVTRVGAVALLASASLIAGALAPAHAYTFTTINNSGDPNFNQLLGINNAGTIAGYFGDGMPMGVPNNGYTLVLPNTYTAENFPAAVQTQVTAINNSGDTVGFYVDGAGDNIGFFKPNGGAFSSVANPNTGPTPAFNQLLGINDHDVAAGAYVDGNGVTQGYIVNLTTSPWTFTTITLPSVVTAVSTTATGINNGGVISGFFTDNATDSVDGFLDNGGSFTVLNFGNDSSTMAFGLNNNNQVVGSYVDGTGTHGFVYNWVSKQLTTIDDPNANGNTSFGVEGTIVNGINDKGQLVGFYADNVNGFLANPVPEPSTWAMMALGFAGLGFAGHRRAMRRAVAVG